MDGSDVHHARFGGAEHGRTVRTVRTAWMRASTSGDGFDVPDPAQRQLTVTVPVTGSWVMVPCWNCTR